MINTNGYLIFVTIYALVCFSASKTSKESICHPNPCGEGTCVDGGDYYTCICPTDGFDYVDNCVTINCFPNPCKNGGVCAPLSGTTTYECLCPDGYNGTNCEIDSSLCHPNPCKNGFPCLIKDGKQVCKCQLPYRGDNCEIGPCTENPCQNRGKCTMYSKIPKCDCLSGYFGERCEKDTCYLRDVCKNGGTCLPDGFQKFKCECLPHYYGIFCENEVNIPKTTEPERITVTSSCDCGRHSLSCDFNQEGNKICSCEAGFSQLNDVCVDCYCGEKSTNCSFGKDLEKKCWCVKGYAQKHGACKETCIYDIDCMNGGICKHNESDGFCECHADYSGDRCEINNACKHLEDICGEHGGICVIRDGLPQCACPPDKEYNDGACETICDASKCVHGQCESFGHSFKCRCEAGYEGNYCDTKIIPSKRNAISFTVFITGVVFLQILSIGVVCIAMYIRWKKEAVATDLEKLVKQT